MSRVLDEHRQYLQDAPRIEAFRRAIAQVVTPGAVVVDIASGTGILGLLACEAGAARVYAIDDGEITEVARRIISRSPFADRITTIRSRAAFTELPERADVAVLDQAGHFGFEAGVIELLDDARRRFLKPGGRSIPESITLIVAPVSCREVQRSVQFWSEGLAGIDLSAGAPVAANSGHPTVIAPAEILGDPQALATQALPPDGIRPLEGTVTTVVSHAGLCTGIGGWFRAQLARGVDLTNAPGDPTAIDRRNVVFPITPPVCVSAGDHVVLSMRILPVDLIVTWDVTITGAGRVERRRGSTFEGMLFSKGDLALTDPASRPRLTLAGEARMTVLKLSDGQHTLREIELGLLDRHPTLFATPADAAGFAAEVLSVYARRDSV